MVLQVRSTSVAGLPPNQQGFFKEGTRTKYQISKFMKLFSLPIFLSLFLPTANAAYRDVVIADDPVGYWRLGEPAASAMATNSGSLGPSGNGTPIQNVTFGLPGALNADPNTAANFDAAQSKIDVPFAPELNTPSFTIEAWAKVASGSSGVHRSPLASRDDNPQKGFIFYAEPGDTWQFWTGTGAQVGWNSVGGAAVELDAWAHLVGTYDGTNKLFYVNGVLVGGNQSVFTPNGARPLRIGASATESAIGDFFFNGDIDEVAVYNKVLGQDRVLAHFTSGSGGAPTAAVAPGFALQPAGRDLFKGETANLTAIATGTLPLRYQWKKDGTVIAGATNSILTLTNLQPAATGSYTVEVNNSAGTLESDPAALAVADMTKPVITQEPRARTILPGTTASFSVQAIGSTTFEYQWQFNGANVAGATNQTLTVTNATQANVGSYRVTVRNAAGATDSATVTLGFPAAATISYADTVKQDAPVGYWRLDEPSSDLPADDEIGANDGAYLNGVTLGRPGALVNDTNTAAGFSAANQAKVDVPFSEALNPPEFTVEAWARVTGGSGHRSPVTSRGDGPQTGYIFYAEPGNTWQFWIGASEPAGWVSLQGPAVQANSYAYLVGVYDGTNLSFYVNGVLRAQRTVAVFAQNTANPLRIGGGATEGDGNFFFEGDVDEVAVYNKALSEDRILAHFVAGFPLTTPPTITLQPRAQVALAGGRATFSVSATGGQPLSYQWRFNGQNIANGTNAVLTLTNVSSANVGSYSVVVSNTGGTQTSSAVNLSIPTASTRSYVELVKGDGPVAYWRLGEKTGEIAEDEIGAQDGAYLNGVTMDLPGAIPNDTNTAAHFTAAQNQKIDVPWSETLNPTNFTAELWARVTGTTGNYRSPLTSRADSPQRGYIFYAEPGNTWQFWSGKGDQTGWDNVAGPAARMNEWTHLVATYDGTTKRFFVNGMEVGSSTAAFGPNDLSPLRIGGGASEGDGNYFFEGDVDEVAIYNKALTAEQIIVHYLASQKAQGPSLGISRAQGNVVLNWGAGTLQSATAVTGPWAAVPNATSPYTVNPNELRARFFRLLVP
jgi:hypothetical protein